MIVVELAIMLAIALLLVLVVWGYLIDRRQRRQEAYIRAYCFPESLRARVAERHPDLAGADWQVLETGLRHFMQIWVAAQPRSVALPSRAVALIWQVFSEDSEAYADFCAKAFGNTLAPRPATTGAAAADPAMIRTWAEACRLDSISPHRATAVPTLFLLDQTIGIADAVVFRPGDGLPAHPAEPTSSPLPALACSDEAAVTTSSEDIAGSAAAPDGDGDTGPSGDPHDCSDSDANADGDSGSDGDGGGDGGGDGD